MSKNSCLAISKAVTDGLPDDAERLVQEAVESGLSPEKILQEGLIAGILKTGELWKSNVYFLPDVMLASKAFKAAMASLMPHLRKTKGDKREKTFVIGVVEGDMHDLGKDIVVAMLQSVGFKVVDLGIDVPRNKFVEAVKEYKPDIIGIGAYMSTTMLMMKKVVTDLMENDLRQSFKVMIGGVPTSQEFADEIGADAWGKDAIDAMEKALGLAGG